MTRIVFVRHGQSMCNLEKRMQGQYDSPLTELGRRQAEAAAGYLAEMQFDAAYSSDLQRAHETGLRIAARHPGLAVIKDAAFRELYAGKWQYMLPADISEAYPVDYAAWKENSWYARPTGGESMPELAKRVREAAWRVACAHKGGTVLVTTHYAPIHTLQCEWLGVPYDKIRTTPPVRNVGVYVVDYDTDNMTTAPVIMGETCFLDSVDETEASSDRV